MTRERILVEQLNFRIKSEDLRELEEIANQQTEVSGNFISVSALVRDIIKWYILKWKEEKSV